MSMSGTKKPKKPSEPPRATETAPVTAPVTTPVSATTTTCPIIKYELVDFIEMVTRDEEHWVEGALPEPKDKSVITKGVTRTDKDDSGNFKQYINVGRDIEGSDSRHPEYGRKITFKVRVKRSDGKTEQLSGVKVVFNSSCEKAATRKTPDANIWQDAELTGNQKSGFSSQGGADTLTVSTDNKGWTPAVTFYLSQYGGDIFGFTAELDKSVKTARKRPPRRAKKYIVWRKFWYQLTYGNYKYNGTNDYEPPSLQQAKDAYKEVFAEMVEAAAAAPQKNVFEKDDLPEDLRKRTFLEEYQVKQGGSTNEVAVIGGHNKTKFTEAGIYKKDNPKGTQPKANLIVCQYQCDPLGKTALGTFDVKQDRLVTLAKGAGSIVCKPPLKPGAQLVVTGRWYKADGHQGGNIVDDCIEVYKERPSTLTVRVDLTKATKLDPLHAPPVPTDAHPVKIKLKLRSAEDYLGESFGDRQILCVYRPSAANKKSGCTEDFNNTVAHELGHMFNQTPKPAAKPPSLKDHPFQYVGHGGSGSHCRNNAQAGATGGVGVYSRNFKSKITSKHNGTTYLLADTSGFIKGHEVKVNGVIKTIKTVYNDGLEFDGPNFDAPVDSVVEQKFDEGLATGKAQTTITHAGANTSTHRVANSRHFAVGETVQIGAEERVIASKPSNTQIKFTAPITTAVNAKVVSKTDWNNPRQNYPRPLDGDCIMYHSFSEKCSNKFCDTCKPYLQLQEMT